MDALASKVRLAALWLLSAIAFFAYRTLALSADATNVSLLGDDFAGYLLLLLGFAFLALTLPTRLNRMVNLVAGAIVGTAQVIMLVDGLVGYPDASFNLMTGATVVSLGAIVWLAARWHEPAAPEAPDRTSQPDRSAAGV